MLPAGRQAVCTAVDVPAHRVTHTVFDYVDPYLLTHNGPARPCACLQVEVDLGLSAHANARSYYDNRRKHQARQHAQCSVLSQLQLL